MSKILKSNKLSKNTADLLEIPPFNLKAYSVDYFHLLNAKETEKKSGIKIIKAEDLPILITINSGVAYIDMENIVQMQVRFFINTHKPNETDMILLSEALTVFDFVVNDFASYKKEGAYNFSNKFFQKLLEISIATSRGLLTAKFSSTFLQNLMIPLMIPQVQGVEPLQ